MDIFNPDGTLLLSVEVSDDSYRYSELMGRDELVLKFALSDYVDIPLGCYCRPSFVSGQPKFELLMPTGLKVVNRRNFEYTLTLESSYGHLRKYRIHNMVDGRLKFDLTARPHEHLEQLVNNLNERDNNEWSIGECIDEDEKLISYDHTTCVDALTQIAQTFETEFEIIGKTISLHKIEYNKESPLVLAYGCGNGFVSGVTRTNGTTNLPVERLWVQGGEVNIDKSKYGYRNLMLPVDGTRLKYDGETFKLPSEPGYASFSGREYKVANGRLAIVRADKEFFTKNEDCLDCSDIYPKRVGIIDSVRYNYQNRFVPFSELPQAVKEGNWNTDYSKILIDFYDADQLIPDYKSCFIAGQSATIVFQSGNLAGREFELDGYVHSEQGSVVGRFKLHRNEIDGELMPNNIFRLKGREDYISEGISRDGDTYAVFNISLPDSYYDLASMEMFKKGVEYMYKHEDVTFSFNGVLDGIYTKKNWVVGQGIGGKLVNGGHISFKDKDIIGSTASFDTRILSIKQPVNNPYSPTITLSNDSAPTSVGSSLKKIESESVHVDELHKQSLEYSRRKYANAAETMSSLQSAFARMGNPVSASTIQTMMALIGDESLQIEFVEEMGSFVPVEWDGPVRLEDGRYRVYGGIIHHMTLGQKSITPVSNGTTYWWDVPTKDFDLNAVEEPLYLYAVVSDEEGEFYVAPEIPEKDDENEIIVIGLFNSADADGVRAFVRLFGFTEILPGRITTDRIVGTGGLSYFDLLNNSFNLGNKLKYNINGSGELVLDGALITELVMAQGGRIVDLIVDTLKTSSEGDRIEILDDLLAMYDTDNKRKLLVSGSPIEPGSQQTYPLNRNSSAKEVRGEEGREEPLEFSEYYPISEEFVVPSGSDVTIPSFVATIEAEGDQSDSEFIPNAHAVLTLCLKSDRVERRLGNAYIDLEADGGYVEDSSSLSISEQTISDLPEGMYRLMLLFEGSVECISYDYVPNESMIWAGFNYSNIPAKELTVIPTEQIVKIGSNGLSASFGAGNEASFVKESTGNVRLELSANGRGIRISTFHGVQIKRTASGNWESL